MKCLSLTQTWASLMALGLKKVETRSWKTHYRGPLAIHAAKGFPRWAIELAREEPFATALVRAGIRRLDELPRGAIIATANLVDCVPTEIVSISEQERAFGDYTPGRWAWFLEDVTQLALPIPWRGQLGLFTVEIPE
ncbi:hypothetical protein LCGC14_1320910 [marine sediment metagenome]|uniref:Uncharacterized protein n=1 Tax=marine sediment metagenome TaxID=412755 RepID=A0A0F9L4Z0_9ZZZZ